MGARKKLLKSKSHSHMGLEITVCDRVVAANVAVRHVVMNTFRFFANICTIANFYQNITAPFSKFN